MRVPLSWLRELVSVDVPVEQLVAVLDELGLAVESVTRIGEGLEGVVVAEVREIAPVPGADRIRLVTVDAAGAEPVSVVCGAWNFAEGDRVPLAPVGTVLPNGMAIGRRRMRGVESNGMLCAPDELGLPGGHEGLLVLEGEAPPGTPIAEALGIVPDVVLELEVNANRPDASSVVGVARDVAATLGLPLTLPPLPVGPEGPAPVGELATVEVEDAEVCGRFVARVLTGVEVRPSPPWLAGRLTAAGMRPINNVVDASNYVMLELGVPNHAYDLARLPGRGLRVRTTGGEGSACVRTSMTPGAASAPSAASSSQKRATARSRASGSVPRSKREDASVRSCRRLEVLAMATGVHHAASSSTSVVVAAISEEAPPMIPAMPTGRSSASQMRQSPAVKRRSTSSRVTRDSPARAARTRRPRPGRRARS